MGDRDLNVAIEDALDPNWRSDPSRLKVLFTWCDTEDDIECTPGDGSPLPRPFDTDPAASHWLIEEMKRRGFLWFSVMEGPPILAAYFAKSDEDEARSGEGPTRLIAIARAALAALKAREEMP